MHRPDEKVPFADSIGALALAHQQGKIRFVGLSNVNAAQIEEAVSIVPIVSVQNSYGPANRVAETDGTLDKCRELGLAFLPFSSFGGVAGAKGLGQSGPLADLSTELGISPQRLVLAWLLQKYDRMIPIPGATRNESIEDNAKADEIMLSPDQIAQLEGAFA
jgi:aryl-alcohol dehydrogenase-like predicted oxidoreductase